MSADRPESHLFGRATVAQVLQAATRGLRRAGVPDAAGDARRLVAHRLGVPLGRLTLMMAERYPADGSDALLDLDLEARARRQPISQIVGSRLFWGRDFQVTSAVLDPRPETEILVAQALAGRFSRVLDLGVGSGCILVTLLAERPGATGLGVDVAADALEVAQANAARHGVEGRAAWRRSSWLDAVGETFDLIVSNPPYVALDEIEALEPEVRDWEPRGALTDGGDGLGAYRAILGEAAPRLVPGGRLLLEIGPTQAGAVGAIGRARGWGEPEVTADLDGRDRVLLFRAPGAPT